MSGRTSHDSVVEQYFRGVARAHTSGYDVSSRPGYVYVRRRELVVDELGGLGGGSLLDVGCGTGAMEEVARRSGFDYRGVDASAEMIDEARRTHPEWPGAYEVGRIEHLEHPDAHFDVVLALGVLEYVHSAELPAAVAELVRVLRPGGHLVASLLTRTAPVWFAREMRDRAGEIGSRLIGRRHVTNAPETLFTERRIRALFGGAGLSVERSTTYAFVLVPTRIYQRHPDRWAARSARLERLSHTPLAPLGLGRLVLATRCGVARIGFERCGSGLGRGSPVRAAFGPGVRARGERDRSPSHRTSGGP